QLDALSEGERELLGIVAAVAGHEAFDVGDRVPVMLLDGLGGLASENLQILVEYLSERTEYLVLTAYPEYEGFEGNELSPSDWQVVSNSSDVGAAS
ncbi:MAG: ATPase, partial [Halobacteriaceae archaeon]